MKYPFYILTFVIAGLALTGAICYNMGYKAYAIEYAHDIHVLRLKLDRVAYQNETNKIAAFKLMQEKEKLKENFELAGRLLREADSLKNCVK